MKSIISSLVLLTGLAAFSACKKSDTSAPTTSMMTVSGALNGSQQVPANPSVATGTLSGTYDKTAKLLKYSVTYYGLTPTIGHFHIGAPGAKGPVAVPFAFNNYTNDGFVSPITGSATLTARQDSALLHSAFYANLHSATYPGGEIRADVTVK